MRIRAIGRGTGSFFSWRIDQEDVSADAGDPGHVGIGTRPQASRMERGGGADLFHDVAAERTRGDLPGAVPGGGVPWLVHHAAADKAELAATAACTLIDDAAYALGKTGLSRAVENDLGDGSLTGCRFTAGLVIDGRGKAIDVAG